ncbi:Iron(3+)-hydroxamate import ATP-binding protein FhuC [Lacunisphaera limnophila]|uniref:Iron(3+)-hydroxamate import ATP-binding protein FhuC n=1 Tax=Lacunisphaera limnophila TaxID=1838286 RepID=A0A1D8ASE7_9BACT|nr:ABC transporter ATP-binding protein [Lacunisphaera limnophila]AOS43824.1 Iron(3+)-hydroxamate import ATP-binding protein FhuC [Lacunisphaera limnophila]
MESSHDIFRLHEITVHYGARCALERVTAQIPCGGLVALVGPNGAGKSTLLKALLGWLPLTRGEVRLGDRHPSHLHPRLAYLPQRAEVEWDFPVSVREVVAQGRWPVRGYFGRLTAADWQRVDEALEELDLTAFGGEQIRRLSGGQQQRMFLARAVAQGADIFLLDEPFTGLDLAATAELLHLLHRWRGQGRTVIAAVHDLPLVRVHFAHALLLDTRLVAAGSVDAVLTDDNLAAAYRQRIPVLGARP